MAIRKFWGWGIEGGGPSAEQTDQIARRLEERFNCALPAALEIPRLEELSLRKPRVPVPDSLSDICSDDPRERVGHHYGRGYRDVVLSLRREFPNPPDWVVFPRNEREVSAVLDWCSGASVAAIPYGGGSTVVGGVEMPNEDSWKGAISLDLTRMRRVMEVDQSSRAARIESGVLGPDLEAQLRPYGLTLRHFPQSFEFSTLGGWIATRSGGHYASLYTHIDDFVEALRVITPTGTIASRRLPGSGAGPSPDRLFVGSEGTLGVITEAWMRLQERPNFRTSASVNFSGSHGFQNGANAVREISQAALFPTNCRLLDATEAAGAGAGDGSAAVLVLGFESADHPQEARMHRVIELCRDVGGVIDDEAIRTQQGDSGSVTRQGATGAWRKAFIEAPYVRDALVTRSVVIDTFETAITWDRFQKFHEDVMAGTHEAVRRICGIGTVTCRFTHIYPDGPAPYYSVTAPGRLGSELEQWDEIKAAASEILIREGGTITHHHAVGRYHRPWYDHQRPDGFAAALRASKYALDPRGILNPGVLFDPK